MICIFEWFEFQSKESKVKARDARMEKIMYSTILWYIITSNKKSRYYSFIIIRSVIRFFYRTNLVEIKLFKITQNVHNLLTEIFRWKKNVMQEFRVETEAFFNAGTVFHVFPPVRWGIQKCMCDFKENELTLHRFYNGSWDHSTWTNTDYVFKPS